MTAEFKQDLHDKFAKLDKNGDRRMDYNEMAAILRKGNPGIAESELELLYKNADKDGNGRIDFDEFVNYVFGKTGPGTSQEFVHVAMPGEGHQPHVLFVSPISAPCRVSMFMVKMCQLPVDLCYPNLAAGHGMDPAHLKINPIHSFPCLGVFPGANGASEPFGINDSTAIADYFERKFPGLVPDSLTGGRDPVRRGKIMEAVNAIKDTMYRATVYQYVYPVAFGGLMTECQYDLCKRDFILEIIDKWCGEGKILGGPKPTLADLYLIAVHMTIMWNTHPDFDREWKWEEVCPAKYPKIWATIQSLLQEPSIKAVHEHNPSAECCGCQLWNDTVAPISGAIAKARPPKGREFVYDHPQGMLHPNAAAAGLAPHAKDFNKIVA